MRVSLGFRKDQQHTIGGEEAHKAYWLFSHPDERGVFSNGVAVVGADIRSIEPDYNAMMGWNPSYALQDADWGDIRECGAEKVARRLLEAAREVASTGKAELMMLPLSRAQGELKLLS